MDWGRSGRRTETIHIVVVVLGFLGLIFTVICCATHNWTDGSGDIGSSGLWKICVLGHCSDVGNFDERDSCRGLVISSLVFGFLGLCSASFVMASNVSYKKKDKMRHGHGAAFFLSALLVFVAVGIYADNYKNRTGISFGYSYYLGIVGGVFFLIASGCALFEKQIKNISI